MTEVVVLAGMLTLWIDEHCYAIERIAPGLDDWAVRVAKEGEEETASYRVAVDRAGCWRCQCKAWKFSKDRPHTCKHVAAVSRLKGLVRELST